MGCPVAQVILAIVQSLGNVLGKVPNEANLFEGYTQLCLAIDEVINEVKFSHMQSLIKHNISFTVIRVA